VGAGASPFVQKKWWVGKGGAVSAAHMQFEFFISLFLYAK